MRQQTKPALSLLPYIKNFFYIYTALIITAAILVYGLSYFGGTLNQITNTAIGASALIMTTLIISKKFAITHRRFFNAQELHRMILGTTALSCLLQIIFLGLYVLMLKILSVQAQELPAELLKNVPFDHAADILKISFSSWGLTFAATFAITFILQTVNFRFIARKVVYHRASRSSS